MEYFTAIWYISWSFGNAVIICLISPCFGLLCKKIWQPWAWRQSQLRLAKVLINKASEGCQRFKFLARKKLIFSLWKGNEVRFSFLPFLSKSFNACSTFSTVWLFSIVQKQNKQNGVSIFKVCFHLDVKNWSAEIEDTDSGFGKYLT
jgi:hypothetical protein